MSNKSEALALLALDELTWEQAQRLNVLTFMQCGHSVVVAPDNGLHWYQEGYIYALRYPDGRLSTHQYLDEASAVARLMPDYVHDVSAVGYCLTLPGVMDNLTMRTLCNRAGEFGWEVTIDDFSANPFEAWAKTTSIALLRAWWHMQEGG